MPNDRPITYVAEDILDLPEVPARLAVIGDGNTGAQLVRRREVVLGAHAAGEFAYPTYSAIIGGAARRLQGAGPRDVAQLPS